MRQAEPRIYLDGYLQAGTSHILPSTKNDISQMSTDLEHEFDRGLRCVSILNIREKRGGKKHGRATDPNKRQVRRAITQNLNDIRVLFKTFQERLDPTQILCDVTFSLGCFDFFNCRPDILKPRADESVSMLPRNRCLQIFEGSLDGDRWTGHRKPAQDGTTLQRQ